MAGFGQLASRIAQQKTPVLGTPVKGKSPYTGPAGFAKPRIPVIGPPGGRLQGSSGPGGFGSPAAPRPTGGVSPQPSWVSLPPRQFPVPRGPVYRTPSPRPLGKPAPGLRRM